MFRKNIIKKEYKVTVIPGDDSGVDVTEACMLVLDALSLPIKWIKADAGYCMWEKYGQTVPDFTFEALSNSDAALLGAVTSKPNLKGFKSAVLQIRKRFDLYINFRPFKSIAGVKCLFKDVDIVLFRENTEGLYSGVEWEQLPQKLISLHDGFKNFEGKGRVAVSTRIISEEGVKRITQKALSFALSNNRKKITIVEKANVLRATGGLFIEVAKSVLDGKIQWEVENVDATAMRLIKDPTYYDVILTSNLFGDILSDECAQIVGGLGVCASANIGDNFALFEPAHGSVPKYAGKYKINPTAMILSAKMLLEYLNLDEYAKRIEKALYSVLKEGKYLTYDLNPENPVSTLKMAEEVAKRL